MTFLDIAQKYFDAWNAHDADAIVKTFADNGIYRDPTKGWSIFFWQFNCSAVGEENENWGICYHDDLERRRTDRGDPRPDAGDGN